MFKMGKFYELFEMDAHIGVEVLGLQYMKGDQPHAGFPEANYHTHAEALARAGLRVVVVEQVNDLRLVVEVVLVVEQVNGLRLVVEVV